jgi:putative resolvase
VPGTLAADKLRLLFVDASELKDDLEKDMIAALTSVCARLYGRCLARNRATRAMALI